MMVYPPEILRLLTPEGFNQAFDEKIGHFSTYSEAYEAVEEIHQRFFTFRKYSDYESFRVSRTYFLKKVKK